jgi:NAD(P) transhydrogenase subunit beta
MTFAIPATLTTVAYIGAIILFIMSLGGLSNPETSRRGNWFGIIGMTIAVLATVFGMRGSQTGDVQIVAMHGLPWIVGAMALGGTIGLIAARVV